MAANDFSTLGGAYSILGQATTSEYNRRKREEEKARRRARRERLFFELTKPILQSAGTAIAESIQSPFTEKYNDFFTNEKIQKRLRSQKRSRKLHEQLTTTRDTIDATGLSEEGYFTQQSKPEHVAVLENEYRKKGMNPQLYSLAIDGEAQKRSKVSGKNRAVAFKTAFEKGQGLYSEEQINTYLQRANTNPKNLWQNIGRKAKRFWSDDDDTQEQRDVKALKALQDTPWAISNAEFKEAMAVFRKTGNNYGEGLQAFVGSKTFGKHNPGTIVEDKKETVRFDVTNGLMYITQEVITRDARTGTTDTKIGGEIQVKLLRKEKDQKVINEKAFLDKQMTLAQWTTMGKNLLSKTGHLKFIEKVNAAGITLGEAKTWNDYTMLTAMFQKALETPGYLYDSDKAKRKQAVFVEFFKGLQQSSDTMEALSKAERAGEEVDFETLLRATGDAFQQTRILSLKLAEVLDIDPELEDIPSYKNWPGSS